ncbi:MAG: GNAT family N-acetyltransferase [Pseudomonadota bacterium]
MIGIDLVRDDALSADALAMISESEAELAAIYPADVRYAFSPDQLRMAGVAFLTAYRNRKPVGCGGVALLVGYGELKRIFVTKTARGTRVAEVIVAQLEDIARNASHPIMRLETGEASPEAIRFYTRVGYQRRGPFGEYIENGSSVFMEKHL